MGNRSCFSKASDLYVPQQKTDFIIIYDDQLMNCICKHA